MEMDAAFGKQPPKTVETDRSTNLIGCEGDFFEPGAGTIPELRTTGGIEGGDAALKVGSRGRTTWITRKWWCAGCAAADRYHQGRPGDEGPINRLSAMGVVISSAV